MEETKAEDDGFRGSRTSNRKERLLENMGVVERWRELQLMIAEELIGWRRPKAHPLIGKRGDKLLTLGLMVCQVRQ